MESYIQISKINDFVFCPRSVYLKSIYDNFQKKTYQSTYQTQGTFSHESIDTKTYSTHKRYLMGLGVYSDTHGICGKIDVYDTEDHHLIERKHKVRNIYDGYRYQLYAQLLCFEEMGYSVKKLSIHSLSDNIRYPVAYPSGAEMGEFISILDAMKSYDVTTAPILKTAKCAKCIYQPLCHTNE